MKKILVSLLLVLALSLGACTSSAQTPTDSASEAQTTDTTVAQTTAQTTAATVQMTEPTDPAEIIVAGEPETPRIVQERVTAEQFREILVNTPPCSRWTHDDYPFADGEFVDITPTDVPNRGNAQLFRHVLTERIFLYANGKASQINCQITWTGTFVSYQIVPCDYNGDGWMDLLVVSEGGSGRAITSITLLDTATYENISVGIPNTHSVYIGSPLKDMPGTYPIYRLYIDYEAYAESDYDEDCVYPWAKEEFFLWTDQLIGYVTNVYGLPTFVKSLDELADMREGDESSAERLARMLNEQDPQRGYTADSFFDLTPKAVAEQTQARILRGAYGRLYFYSPNGVNSMDLSFWEYFLSAVPCDPEGDGKTEILATLSMLDRRIVRFDPETAALTIVYGEDTSEINFDQMSYPYYMRLRAEDPQRAEIVLSVVTDRLDLLSGNYETLCSVGCVSLIDGTPQAVFSVDGAEMPEALRMAVGELNDVPLHAFFDVTPDAIRAQSDYRIVLYRDEAVYFFSGEQAGSYRYGGGFSMNNAVLCDLDRNGNDEILLSMTADGNEMLLHYDICANAVTMVASAETDPELSVHELHYLIGEASPLQPNVLVIYSATDFYEDVGPADGHAFECIVGLVTYEAGKPIFRPFNTLRDVGKLLPNKPSIMHLLDVTPANITDPSIRLIREFKFVYEKIFLHLLVGDQCVFSLDITEMPSLLSAVPCDPNGDGVTDMIFTVGVENGSRLYFFNGCTGKCILSRESTDQRLIACESNGEYFLKAVSDEATIYEIVAGIAEPVETVGQITVVNEITSTYMSIILHGEKQ